MGKKLTNEYVHQYFQDQGCYLLEEYVHAHYKVAYICECGNIAEIAPNAFKKGNRCYDCGIKKCSDSRRLKHKDVEKYFADQNCILLDRYTDANKKVAYICECGNISEITYANFMSGVRCYDCGLDIATKKQRFTYEYVKKYFEKHKCILLEEEYKNAMAPMVYICQCGNISVITFNNFTCGQRCKECGQQKSRRYGDEHWLWKPELTHEERFGKRGHSQAWKRHVKKRDGNKCVVCGSPEKLHAHHLNSWSSNKKLRLSESNGVTLCQKCHYDFHMVYGRANNTERQFNEYLKNRLLRN